MRDIELALAVSTRGWSDRLHRFLVDHGGARVRLYVMQPQDAFSERFDVLLIDDICSFLSPHLVDKLNRSGRRVVGVYDPAEFPDGKDRLLACEVTEVIEADAAPRNSWRWSIGWRSLRRRETIRLPTTPPAERSPIAPRGDLR